MSQLGKAERHAPTQGLDVLEPFLEWARNADERGPAANARGEGQPVVGLFCSFVPAEIVLACGATPVRLCAGSHHLTPAVEGALPRDACPVVKSAVSGLVRAEPDARPDLVIAPASCDWKAKLTAALDGSVPVLEFSIPHRRDVGAFARELADLTVRLGDLTDFTATRGTLEEARQAVAAAEDEMRALHRLRMTDPPGLRGSAAMLIAQGLGLVHPRRWTEATRQARQAAQARQSLHAQGRARLLLTGSPVLWPSFKVPELVEQAGGEVVAEDFCSRMEALYQDERQDGDDVLTALAQRSAAPCACAGREGERRALVGRLLQDFAVTGIIIHVLKGCAPVAMDVAAMRRLASEHGVPVLEIETDHGREDVEPLRTRLETFVEVAAAGRRT